jgi:hypothetical protein
MTVNVMFFKNYMGKNSLKRGTGAKSEEVKAINTTREWTHAH